MELDGIWSQKEIAEFERVLTQERVRAGLRLAKSKGKRLGRPRSAVNPEQVATLRAAGASWQTISTQLGIGVGTACPFGKNFLHPE